MIQWLKRGLAVSALALVAACGSDDETPVQTLSAQPTLVQVAQSDPRFSVLVEAVVAADLADDLSADGNLTVFAPTNDAFASLLQELGVSKAQLLADKALLTQVLQYHVLPGRVVKADVPVGRSITPLAGGIFKIDASGDALIVTDGRNRKAGLVSTDVLASNGVIHVLDKVLLPANQTIVQTAASLADFSILVDAVKAAGLVDALSADGAFTVFAPTNRAFADLLQELQITQAQLLADKTLLTQVLTYHVLPARALKAEVPLDQALKTLQGETLTIDASLSITDSRGRRSAIVATDVLTSNGVIHVIDKVILPSAAAPAPASE